LIAKGKQSQLGSQINILLIKQFNFIKHL